MKRKREANGNPTREKAIAELRRKMTEAVQDLPDAEPATELTPGDVKTLRDAGFEELADVAEIYVEVDVESVHA